METEDELFLLRLIKVIQFVAKRLQERYVEGLSYGKKL